MNPTGLAVAARTRRREMLVEVGGVQKRWSAIGARVERRVSRRPARARARGMRENSPLTPLAGSSNSQELNLGFATGGISLQNAVKSAPQSGQAADTAIGWWLRRVASRCEASQLQAPGKFLSYVSLVLELRGVCCSWRRRSR